MATVSRIFSGNVPRMQPLYPGLTFVDVSGMGNSGKTAVTDILREFPLFWTSANTFEFDLFRVPGGVLDLHHHLVEDWSPIRSHHAINDFVHVVETMGVDPKPYDVLGLIDSSSQRYDRPFGGRFRQLANAYADKFRKGTYRSVWPYDLIHENSLTRFAKKFIVRLTSPRSTYVAVQLADGDDFKRSTTDFLNELFRPTLSAGQTGVVLNNAFEAYNPERGLEFLENSYSFIVTRDPRDVYVSGLSSDHVDEADKHLQASENDGYNKSFLASDDLDLFIVRYRILAEHVYRGKHPRVCVLRFEEIALDYENSLNKIINVLGLPREAHKFPKKHFNPDSSKKNVGLWKTYSKQEEIRHIERELGAYLWT